MTTKVTLAEKRYQAIRDYWKSLPEDRRDKKEVATIFKCKLRTIYRALDGGK